MPELSPYRWVIYFRDWPELEARKYPLAFERLETQVKPYRDSLTGQIHQSDFWKFWDLRPSLMRAVEDNEWLLASGRVAKYLVFRRVPSRYIYNEKTKLYFLSEWSDFAILQSSVHIEWAFWTCGTLGAAALSYSTKAALETWPMPSKASMSQLNTLGERFHTSRELVLKKNAIGLLDFYNHMHDPASREPWVSDLRATLRLMDRAVIDAYGWSDLDLEHGFHKLDYLPPKDCVRFTISPRARVEVLRRLSELNRERYEVEQSAQSKRKAAKRISRRDRQVPPSLLNDERLAER